VNDVAIRVSERRGRRHAASGARWESVVGYSRAVRTGAAIAVSGTVGVNSDGSYPPSLAVQTRRALEIVRAALEALGGRIEDVVRTRMYVVDASRWEEVGRVHGEVFADVRPATSLVQVAALIDPEALVEIEADAVVG
jgi:enamine deaminase RidA (YjgF/YER057c/UK114 family)